jgi:hypothetical protein
VGRYGLRVFHGHVPREKPCAGISTANPVITAVYEDYLGYKNGRNGVIGGNMGAVVFRNITVADNRLAGIEIEKDVNSAEMMGYVDGALVVGRTEGNMALDVGSPRGIITPRTDRWWVKNVKFYNFNFADAAALGSCSHCFHAAATDSDSRTVKFENLLMDPATVTKKIRYQFPFKGIFHDTDGSWIPEKTLEGDAWATSNWGHNIVDPACERSLDIYDGIICEGNVTVRRVVMYNYSPGSLRGRTLYVLPYDDAILEGKTEEEIKTYEAEGDPANGYELTAVPFRRKTNPANHWTVPFVTGHKYYLRWEYGLDFETMRFEIEQWRWDDPEDKNIEFEMPFYDQREAITVDGNDGVRLQNNTLWNG